MSFLPPLCRLLHALNVSVACERALGGAGGALLRAHLGVQWHGERSVEWRRGSSALALLPAPGRLCLLAVDRVQLLVPTRTVLHILLPLQLFFAQAVINTKSDFKQTRILQPYVCQG